MSDFRYWKCDRCGHKSEHPGHVETRTDLRFWQKVVGNGPKDRSLDLCAACAESFEKWVNAAEAAS